MQVQLLCLWYGLLLNGSVNSIVAVCVHYNEIILVKILGGGGGGSSHSSPPPS